MVLPPKGGNSILTIICYTSHTSAPPKGNDFGPLWDPQIDAKIGSRNQRPKKLPKTSPKATRKGAKGRAKRVPWEPQNAGCGIQSTAQALLGLKSVAQALAARGGSTTRPRLVDKGVHENIRRPSSPPGPSMETGEEQNKILERQHNKNRGGGKA